MKKLKIFLLMLPILILYSCFSNIKTEYKPPTERDIQKKFIAEASYDQTWTAVIETFAELNLPIDNLEKDSGLITTDWIQVPKNYADCGSLTGPYELDGKFNVFVKSENEKTIFTINTSYQATMRLIETYQSITCYSTGELEKTMNEIIQQKISQ